MPFVTEALWATIPHREDDPDLLIVARWPQPAGRDPVLELEVGAIVELVRGIRNARAEARVEPAARLPVDVAVPARLAPTFAALAPAVERLARARPLRTHPTAAALHDAAGPDGLAVIAGDLEAVVGVAPSGEGTGRQDSARLEKELADAERFLVAARARLADRAFLAKAPPAVVEGARTREVELAETVARLKGRLGRA
jgi:valyl-tRNA synthetase